MKRLLRRIPPGECFRCSREDEPKSCTLCLLPKGERSVSQTTKLGLSLENPLPLLSGNLSGPEPEKYAGLPRAGMTAEQCQTCVIYLLPGIYVCDRTELCFCHSKHNVPAADRDGVRGWAEMVIMISKWGTNPTTVCAPGQQVKHCIRAVCNLTHWKAELNLPAV